MLSKAKEQKKLKPPPFIAFFNGLYKYVFIIYGDSVPALLIYI
jgi:hypothetical protein